MLFSNLFPVLLLFTFWMVIPIILCLFVGVSKEKKKFDEKTEMAKRGRSNPAEKRGHGEVDWRTI